MKRSSAMIWLIASCLFAGCAPDPSQRLVGRWAHDKSTVKYPAHLTAEQLKVMKKVEVITEISRDGRLSIVSKDYGPEPVMEFEWKFVSVDGDTLKISMKRKGATEVGFAEVRFLNDDQFESPMGSAEGATTWVRYDRVKESP